MKIDSHQHFWKYKPEEFGWINENMKSIRRDFLPENLYPELLYAGFSGSIAVQARQSVEETYWLLELANKFDFIKGVVGWVDLCANSIHAQLEQLSDKHKLVGVRHVLQDEPDDSFMLRKEFLNGIKSLDEFGLCYDLLIFPGHLDAAIELVKMFPRQKFILDHIGKPSIKEGLIEPWKKGITKLAENPNVFCKLSGMVTEASWTGWKPSDFEPYMNTIMEAFSSERLMIGSDWPVCTLAGKYEAVINIVEEFCSKLSLDEKTNILGNNAARVYGIH